MKRLSDGFAGANTRSLSDLEREIEYRLGNLTHMDIFTDSLKPDEFGESTPGADYSKQKYLNVGNVKEQEELDDMDKEAYADEVKIKDPKDQFPGSKLDRLAEKIAEKVWQKSLEGANKEIEKRMTLASSSDVVDKMVKEFKEKMRGVSWTQARSWMEKFRVSSQEQEEVLKQVRPYISWSV